MSKFKENTSYNFAGKKLDNPGREIKNRLAKFSLPILLILTWWFVTSRNIVSQVLLPSPNEVLETTIYLIKSGELTKHITSSALRVSQGYILAVIAALSIGILMGVFKWFNHIVDLIIQILKPVPPIAWIPLAILWFGIDEGAKIFIIALGSFFPILVSTVDAIRQIDPKYLELAKNLELPKTLLIKKIIVPGSLPHIMTGMRLGLALAWMCVVAAELIAASSGIGFLIMDGRSVSQIDLVIVGMVTLGIIGKFTDDALRLLENKMVK